MNEITLPPRKGNWRRCFCWWWGHEYVNVVSPTSTRLVLVCLRCYARGEHEFTVNMSAAAEGAGTPQPKKGASDDE